MENKKQNELSHLVKDLIENEDKINNEDLNNEYVELSKLNLPERKEIHTDSKFKFIFNYKHPLIRLSVFIILVIAIFITLIVFI